MTRSSMGDVLIYTIIFTIAGGSVPTTAWPQRVDFMEMPTLTLTNRAASDQDDMAFWVDETTPSRSTVITSDKDANRLFVYDLQGKLIQAIDAAHPGNIDVRQGVPWYGKRVAIVAVNERDDRRLAVFQVDAASRRLQRMDRGDLGTQENYGFALFQPDGQNRLFGFCTSKQSGVLQIELLPSDDGNVTCRTVRHWDLPMCEGVVADDRTGEVFVSVEQEGIYLVDPKAESREPPRLVIPIGQDGFRGDAEGVTLVRRYKKTGLLIVSDQGSSNFRVYRRDSDFTYVGTFAVAGAERTDGIDVTLTSLGERFPGGAFVCHSDVDEGRRVFVTNAAFLRNYLSDNN